MEQLKAKLAPRVVEEYVISTEKHGAGGEHKHVYLKLDERCDILDNRRLDLEDEDGKVCHGNYQSCRSYRNVVGYIVKDGMGNVATNKRLDDLGREVDG